MVEFTCGIEQMVNFMAAIANSSRLLATRDIRIRPDKPEVKSIAVTMTVAGFLPMDRAPELAENAAGAAR